MGLFPKRLTGFFLLFSILIFIYFLKYETIVGSSAWSFGDSDSDPSSVFVFFQYVCIKLIEKTLMRYQKSKSKNKKNKNCLTTIAFPVH